jgi:hypothetical protein
MVIEDVIESSVLEERFNALCESNWKIKGMAKNLSGGAKDKIDNWYSASRDNLLRMLGIIENAEFPKVYHDNPPAEEN